MSQFSYVPGDSRLVDHIIGELKSKGIFDQFRKECIADVDTKPAYQNLRVRVETSVSGFLARQTWKPDLNKNQLREKLRKHLIEANYLEQGVERIVDQVVNPKVASVFIPQVEDLVYSYLGIQRPKSNQNTHNAYTTFHPDENTNNLLPTDLEAVSPESVKSQESQKDEKMEISDVEQVDEKMVVDSNDTKLEKREFQSPSFEGIKKNEAEDAHITVSDYASHESNDSTSKIKEKKEIKEEEIIISTELSNLSIDIPLPSEPPKIESQDESTEFKQSDINDESSSDSTMMRNVSPLTPIRSFNNENSCDAQPPFDERKNALENNGEKTPAENPIPISTFRFTIETEANIQDTKPNKPVSMERSMSYQYSDSNLNNYSAPTYDDSSSSNNLHIDYQSDRDAATVDKTEDTKTERVIPEQKSKDEDEKKRSHKSSHSSKDRHSSSRHSKDRRSDYKHHSSSDKKDSKTEKRSTKDDSHKSRHSSHTDRSKDKNDIDKSKERNDRDRGKDSVEKKEKERSDTSKDRYSSSHKISSSSNRDSKSKHRASSSSRRHSSSSSKLGDEKKSSSKSDDKKDGKDHRSSSKSSRDHSRQTSSHRSDKDKLKSSSSKDKHDKHIKKDDKKDKKVTDDHYSASGRGNRTRRSTDRDSNDGNSSSSKGSTFTGPGKTATTTGDNKSSSSKTDNQSSSDSAGQSDSVEQCSEAEKVKTVNESVETNKLKPVIKLDSQLKTPVVDAPELPSVKEMTVKKPMIAANMIEAIKLMKIRREIAAEQEKKRQEATLLIEFQEKIHSSVSQVFSGISGPELEFTCTPKYNNDVKAENTGDTDQNSKLVIEAEKTAYQNEEVQIETEENPEQNLVIVIETENKIEEKKELDESKPNIDEENIVIVIQTENDETDNCNNETIKEPEIASQVSKDNVTNVEDIGNKEKSEQDTLDDEYLNFMYGDPCKEMDLHYFSQQEIFQAESEIDAFEKIYKSFDEIDCTKKVFLYNCETFVENVVREICQEMENHTVINFTKNDNLPKSGPSKLNTPDLVASSELILPRGQPSEDVYPEDSLSNSPYIFSSNFSSDCSLDMSSDYEKKIDEMKLTTSRQEVMEIILGGIPPDSPSKMPKIVFGEIYVEEEQPKPNLKRKNGMNSFDGAENINHKVLMPNKMRKLSLSDQISSTTESVANCSRPVNNFKSKLTGKARQVGLPKPKNTPTTVPVSPSSDKSVENYIQNDQNEKTSPKLNGTVPKNKVENMQNQKTTKRATFQRYDTSDLYKPKLHYLSRRHR